MLEALGYGFLDADGKQVPYGANGLALIETITDEHVMPELKECKFRIACDVTIRCVALMDAVLFLVHKRVQHKR